MPSLKGQNLRVFSGQKVIAMASNCTITFQNNTSDESHKDIVGMAALPNIVSKAWSIQVESFDVMDMTELLYAMKGLASFQLFWDETSPTNNQNPVQAEFRRMGAAYLTDATFTFNDRESASKNITFTGKSPIAAAQQTSIQTVPVGAFTKGQFTRLFLGNDNSGNPDKVIAFAKQLSFHVSVTLEDASTKDTEGIFQVQEPTAINFDITTQALVRSADAITSSVGGQTFNDLETIYEQNGPVSFDIANVGDENNRSKTSSLITGSVVLQTLTLNAPNRQVATYTAQLQGYGIYEVSH